MWLACRVPCSPGSLSGAAPNPSSRLNPALSPGSPWASGPQRISWPQRPSGKLTSDLWPTLVLGILLPHSLPCLEFTQHLHPFQGPSGKDGLPGHPGQRGEVVSDAPAPWALKLRSPGEGPPRGGGVLLQQRASRCSTLTAGEDARVTLPSSGEGRVCAPARLRSDSLSSPLLSGFPREDWPARSPRGGGTSGMSASGESGLRPGVSAPVLLPLPA